MAATSRRRYTAAERAAVLTRYRAGGTLIEAAAAAGVTRAAARSWVSRAGIGRGRGRKSAPSYPPGGSAAEALGAVLCLVRLAAGKTLAEVGRAVGRGAGTIHRYEHGSAPRAAFVHLPRVAAVLGTTAADLHRAARALMEVSPCPASAPAPAPSLPPPPPETTRSAPRAG